MFDPASSPFLIPKGVESRSITFENPTGEKGKGGKAASGLGVGRKGAPLHVLMPGEEIELANVKGPGCFRHIWVTTMPDPVLLRGVTIRVYWEKQQHPSIEAPIGDFFGFAHGMPTNYASAAHSLADAAGMNIWLPMPFAKHARVTLTNETDRPAYTFFQIDYTIGDSFPNDFGRLHVLFQRQNPTAQAQDFEILPLRKSRGVYIGAVLGIRPLAGRWWGEGEVKIFLDGDKHFPTIAGSGTEDYVGHSFGIQNTTAPYNGASWRENAHDSETGRVSLYRWHLADPVYWHKDVRITLQQIGCCKVPPTSPEVYLQEAIFEREDDVSCATFWYEPSPSAPLPAYPDLATRITDLPEAMKTVTID
ncbi:glycoside hydrolase family 172 protein [Marinicaulis aureus]|uniref:Glycoside hydrolase family 172 protein n=1 Tax=Hyphococcus aureus TaxID=2666033 RepID=A0ABW1KY92_9PROT